MSEFVDTETIVRLYTVKKSFSVSVIQALIFRECKPKYFTSFSMIKIFVILLPENVKLINYSERINVCLQLMVSI